MIKGLIYLLHKGGSKDKLTNEWPITFLNVAYKISAKALQQRPEPILLEVIDSYQIVFLTFRYSLDNIFLSHEVLQWAKESKQDYLFLNLGFVKTYDKIT